MNNDFIAYNPIINNKETYTYRDFASAPDDGTYRIIDLDNMSPSSIRVLKLPAKLRIILSKLEYSHIISWMPHGRAWKILDIKSFNREIMVKYFEHSNYRSFIRLVNAWGFRRVSSGPDQNSYYHELFLRGLPHLQAKMCRLTKNSKKLPAITEPDFYKINKSSPLPEIRIIRNSLRGSRTQLQQQQIKNWSIYASQLRNMSQIDKRNFTLSYFLSRKILSLHLGSRSGLSPIPQRSTTSLPEISRLLSLLYMNNHRKDLEILKSMNDNNMK